MEYTEFINNIVDIGSKIANDPESAEIYKDTYPVMWALAMEYADLVGFSKDALIDVARSIENNTALKRAHIMISTLDHNYQLAFCISEYLSRNIGKIDLSQPLTRHMLNNIEGMIVEPEVLLPLPIMSDIEKTIDNVRYCISYLDLLAFSKDVITQTETAMQSLIGDNVHFFNLWQRMMELGAKRRQQFVTQILEGTHTNIDLRATLNTYWEQARDIMANPHPSQSDILQLGKIAVLNRHFYLGLSVKAPDSVIHYVETLVNMLAFDNAIRIGLNMVPSNVQATAVPNIASMLYRLNELTENDIAELSNYKLDTQCAILTKFAEQLSNDPTYAQIGWHARLALPQLQDLEQAIDDPLMQLLVEKRTREIQQSLRKILDQDSDRTR